jgi:hypothetical protein
MAKLSPVQIQGALDTIRATLEGSDVLTTAWANAMAVAVDALTDRLQYEQGEWVDIPDTEAWRHLQAVADVITPLKQELGLIDGFHIADGVKALADAYSQLRRIGGYPLENYPRPPLWDGETVAELLDNAGRFNAERTEKTTSIGFILAALRIMNGDRVPLIKDGE